MNLENRNARITELTEHTMQPGLVSDFPPEEGCLTFGFDLESVEPFGPVVREYGTDHDFVDASGERFIHFVEGIVTMTRQSCASGCNQLRRPRCRAEIQVSVFGIFFWGCS